MTDRVTEPVSDPGAAGRHAVSSSPMRTAIARRMSQSKREAPHFYVSTEIEVDALARLVERRNAALPDGERLTLTVYLVKAVALALVEHPSLNAVWRGEVLERWDAVNVGVAVAVDDGLIAPALLDCGRRSIAELGAALADLVTRTRALRLRPAELNEATFTLSNLGMFDVTQFTAIVTPPQVAILATGRAVDRPVVRDGQVVVRRILAATVSADHRAVDGADAARFLGTLKTLVESPEGWATA